MYGDYYYPQNAPIQWRYQQRNNCTTSSDSPLTVPLLAVTFIIIFFLCMSSLPSFFKGESYKSCSKISIYLILIAVLLVLLCVVWHVFWDCFIEGIRPSIWYCPEVGQCVDGVSACTGSGGGGGVSWSSVMVVAAVLALVVALAFCNPVLSIPVALAGVINLSAAVF